MRSPKQTRCGDVKANAQARRPINAFQHGASGAFAIGAGDMDEPEWVLRITRQRRQLESILQPQLAPNNRSRKESDGFGISHLIEAGGES